VSSEFRFVNAGEVFESSVGRQGFMPGGILCPPVLGVNYFFKPIDDAVSEHFAWFRREDWTSTDDGFCLLSSLCYVSVLWSRRLFLLRNYQSQRHREHRGTQRRTGQVTVNAMFY